MLSSSQLLATVRLLASDLDGTLLDPDHRPAPGTLEAIAAYQEAGGIFAVCTGRDKGSARGVLKGLDVDRLPGVYMNGTIVQGPEGVPLQSATVPQKLVLEMVEWGRKHRDVASILFVDGDVHYVMDRSEEWAMFMHRHLLDPDPIQVEGGWESATPAIPTHVNLMRVICSPERMDLVKPQVQECVHGQASCAQSLPTTIDIMAPRTNKATGLHVLLEALGLREAQTCAIGDSENDLEMLQSVRVACAMGNAAQKTKAVAHFVMPRNCDEPAGVVALVRSLTAALAGPPPPPPVAAGARIRVACFGSGSWGSPVARMMGQSLLHLPQFEEGLTLWVQSEEEGGQHLVEVINSTRENPKYMPGLRFPRNVTATSDAKAAAAGADILVFTEREEVVRSLLDEISGEVKSSATAVIMSKDMIEIGESSLRFGTQIVQEKLGIPVAVLMGGTLASEVAAGCFAEATLGCEDADVSKALLALFNRPNFSVRRVKTVQAVELFAVLKSIVSLAAGLCDGLGLEANTKAAVVRIGAVEISHLATHLYPQLSTADVLQEACGWTDLIASSFGNSRNRRCAEAFAQDPARGWEACAAEVLGQGQGLPSGVGVVANTMAFIRGRHIEAMFPFIGKVSRIVSGKDAPRTLTEMAVPRVRSSKALKVAVMGSGNWGTAIARIICQNALKLPDFHKTVTMWVHEELVDGQKLTEIINTRHENVKYLPGYELPANLVAAPDAAAVAREADILVFVLPHQFLGSLLDTIAAVVQPGALAISMIKGYVIVEDGGKGIRTGTQVIAERLGLGGCAFMGGANVANDVARGHFAEATLACSEEESALLLSRLLNTPEFSVRTSPDVVGVELFGGLKNVVALTAGFCDGLGLSANTKAAVMRRGLLEMLALVRELFPSSSPDTVHESCGFADLLTTCFSGRNRRCAEAFAKDPTRSWADIEAELLEGQKLQGPSMCLDVQAIIEHRGLTGRFPLFTATHGAVTGKIRPEDVFTAMGFLGQE